MNPIYEICTIPDSSTVLKPETAKKVAAETPSLIELIITKKFNEAVKVGKMDTTAFNEVDGGKSGILHHLTFVHSDKLKYAETLSRQQLIGLALDNLSGQQCLEKNCLDQSPLEVAIYHDDQFLFAAVLAKVRCLFTEKTNTSNPALFSQSLLSILKKAPLMPEHNKVYYQDLLNLFADSFKPREIIRTPTNSKSSNAGQNHPLRELLPRRSRDRDAVLSTLAQKTDSLVHLDYKLDAKIYTLNDVTSPQIEDSQYNDENVCTANSSKDARRSKNFSNLLQFTNQNIHQKVISVPDHDSPLQRAIHNNDSFTIKEILTRSSKESLLCVNHKDETALFTAIKNGTEELALQLFKKCPEAICNITTTKMDTAFTLALEKNFNQLVAEIILELRINKSLHTMFESTFKGIHNQILKNGEKVLNKLRELATHNSLPDLLEWTKVEPLVISKPQDTTVPSEKTYRRLSPGYLTATKIRKPTPKPSTPTINSKELERLHKSMMVLKTIEKMKIARKLTPEEIRNIGYKHKLIENAEGFNILHILIRNNNTEAALQVIDYVDRDVLIQPSANSLRVSPKDDANTLLNMEIISAIDKKLNNSF